MIWSGMVGDPLPQLWHIGTIGFGYDDWSGVFYPSGMKASNYLTHYSRIFNAVEIDSTFHAPPKRENLLRWLASTPTNFQFCLKMPKEVTHRANLTDKAYPLASFLDTTRILGEKLGVILVQFPPSFRHDQKEELIKFLENLPADLRFAVEVRHQSWYTAGISQAEPEFARILRDRGVCWVASDYPRLPKRIWQTASFFYFRWIGQHGSFAHHTHERIDRSADLGEWQKLIQEMDFIGEKFGFFNNDYGGFAPGTANRFKLMMGLETTPFNQPQQGLLF